MRKFKEKEIDKLIEEKLALISKGVNIEQAKSNILTIKEQDEIFGKIYHKLIEVNSLLILLGLQEITLEEYAHFSIPRSYLERTHLEKLVRSNPSKNYFTLIRNSGSSNSSSTNDLDKYMDEKIGAYLSDIEEKKSDESEEESEHTKTREYHFADEVNISQDKIFDNIEHNYNNPLEQEEQRKIMQEDSEDRVKSILERIQEEDREVNYDLEASDLDKDMEV